MRAFSAINRSPAWSSTECSSAVHDFSPPSGTGNGARLSAACTVTPDTIVGFPSSIKNVMSSRLWSSSRSTSYRTVAWKKPAIAYALRSRTTSSWSVSGTNG